MSSQDSRTVLVTGANKGIGYEAVKLLSQQLPAGKVILTTRSVKNGEDALKKMREAEPNHKFDNVSVLQLDITDAKSLSSGVAKVKSEFGKLDVLLHNSGIASVDGDWNSSKVLDTNLQGAYDTIAAFKPIIAHGGSVVVVSSEVGAWGTASFSKDLQQRITTPEKVTWKQIQDLSADWVAYSQKKQHKEEWPEITPMTSAYTTSKALLTAWLRALALEEKDVKVAIVCPGYCATDLNYNSGHRTAAKGAESVTWPVFHSFQSGKFYQDGDEHGFVTPMPDEFKNATFEQ